MSDDNLVDPVEIQDDAESIQHHEDQAENVETVSVQLGEGELRQPDPALNENLPNHLRKLYREAKKEAQEERKRREALEAKVNGAQGAEVLGPMPQLTDESIGYDPEKLAEARIAWTDKKRAIDAEAARIKKLNDDTEADYQSRVAKYETSKASLPFDDFDIAEEEVQRVFSPTQRGLIIKASLNPAEFIYALGINADKAKALAAITDPVDFLAAAVRLEAKELKVEKRASVPGPESKIRPTAPVGGVTVDKKLQALEDDADKTGDRTKLIAYKRELRQKDALARR